METGTFPVSTQAPFLSNLNVLDNITLIHDNLHHFTQKSSEALVLEKLSLLGLQELARVHHSTVNDRELFFLQLIRASIKEDQNIIIDSPFLMVSIEKDVTFLIEALSVLNLDYKRLLIVDITSQKHKYKEEFCHIEEC